MNSLRKADLKAFVAAAVIFAVIYGLLQAEVIGAFWELNLVLIGINIILATSLNMINGYTGQFSIGHAGFLAVGAYVGAIMTVKLGFNMAVALIAGTAAAGLLGFLVGLPTLRLNTTSPMGLYYDLESTNGTLDVAYLKFNEVKTLTVELAEVETSVIRLAEAIQKTQKRANALGNVQIPQMQKTIKSIDEVLSEREREEFSRLKVIKAQKEKEEA